MERRCACVDDHEDVEVQHALVREEVVVAEAADSEYEALDRTVEQQQILEEEEVEARLAC